MKHNIFNSHRQSIYSTNNSTLPLIIQLQYELRSHIKLIKIVNPTFIVYIIVLCPENASNDTVTGLNWISWYWQNGYIPDTGKVSSFWMSFGLGHTFMDKRQNTRNRRQNQFLPLKSTFLKKMEVHVPENWVSCQWIPQNNWRDIFRWTWTSIWSPTWKLGFLIISKYLARYCIQLDPLVTEGR